MALLGAAQVACPGCNRRVELAQSFDAALRQAQEGPQDVVLDADGDIRHGVK